MSDDVRPGKPKARPLDGVLDELRQVLASQPSVSDLAAPVSESSPPAPPLEVIVPEPAPALEPARDPFTLLTPAAPEPVPPMEIAPEPAAPAAPQIISGSGFVPPIPTGLETAPERWQLRNDGVGADVPPPTVSTLPGTGSTPMPVPDAPSAGWIQGDALARDEAAPALPTEMPTFVPAAAVPASPAFDEPAPAPALDIPIPGTMETREVTIPEPPTADLNDLDQAEVRPDGLVQIACLFPEGAEKTGQLFVNKLREAAGRLKKPLTVQPVFLHTWSPDAVNIAAWAKSAALSGADAVFVVAPKASATLFAKLAVEAANAGTTGRMVASEQIPTAALYADILVDLKRKANGPR